MGHHEKSEVLNRVVNDICATNPEFKHRVGAVKYKHDPRYPTKRFIEDYQKVIEGELAAAEATEMVTQMPTPTRFALKLR